MKPRGLAQRVALRSAESQYPSRPQSFALRQPVVVLASPPLIPSSSLAFSEGISQLEGRRGTWALPPNPFSIDWMFGGRLIMVSG